MARLLCASIEIHVAHMLELRDRIGGDAHLYHYDWLPPLSSLYPLRVDAASESAKFAELGAINDIDPAHCHWTDVVINDSLPALVEEVDAAVVVMGAIYRSAVHRAFVGSAAERLLDELVCDVLVVKLDLLVALAASTRSV